MTQQFADVIPMRLPGRNLSVQFLTAPHYMPYLPACVLQRTILFSSGRRAWQGICPKPGSEADDHGRLVV